MSAMLMTPFYKRPHDYHACSMALTIPNINTPSTLYLGTLDPWRSHRTAIRKAGPGLSSLEVKGSYNQATTEVLNHVEAPNVEQKF